MAEAHNHHFVPQGYLRGFADGVGRKARLLTIDRFEGRAFKTLVRNVAASRDFRRIEAEGVQPNYLEEGLGKFEAVAAEALRRIESAQSLDSDQDRLILINLIALLAAQNPRSRLRFGRFLGDTFRLMAEAMVSTRERWSSVQEQIKAAKGEVRDDASFSYEQMRDFVHSDDYDIGADQTYQIGLELRSMDAILRALVSRQWSLFRAPQASGDFVTSDHPVCLLDISDNPSSIYGVGFGMTQTAVLFPLSRRLMLLGRFEGVEEVREVGPLDVAQLNSQVIQFAERQVYAFDDAFRYARHDGVADGARLVTDPLFRTTTVDDEKE